MGSAQRVGQGQPAVERDRVGTVSPERAIREMAKEKGKGVWGRGTGRVKRADRAERQDEGAAQSEREIGRVGGRNRVSRMHQWCVVYATSLSRCHRTRHSPCQGERARCVQGYTVRRAVYANGGKEKRERRRGEPKTGAGRGDSGWGGMGPVACALQ